MEGPPTLTLDATNAKCYADRYPDLKAAFGYNTNALIDHWNRHGKTEGRYFNCGGQLSKTVDTSACNFKNDNVVYITSVGGVTDHWRLTGTTAYSESSASQFTMKLLQHPSQISAEKAKEKGYFVNWCGVGETGDPTAGKTPSLSAPSPAK